MKKEKYIYIEPYKMLFILEDGGYYPLYYDCKKTENGYEGKVIKSDTILGNWLLYVKHSFKIPSKNSSTYAGTFVPFFMTAVRSFLTAICGNVSIIFLSKSFILF